MCVTTPVSGAAIWTCDRPARSTTIAGTVIVRWNALHSILATRTPTFACAADSGRPGRFIVLVAGGRLVGFALFLVCIVVVFVGHRRFGVCFVFMVVMPFGVMVVVIGLVMRSRAADGFALVRPQPTTAAPAMPSRSSSE